MDNGRNLSMATPPGTGILGQRIAHDPNRPQAEYMARAASTSRFAWSWALAKCLTLHLAWLDDPDVPWPDETLQRGTLNTTKRHEFPRMLEVTKSGNGGIHELKAKGFSIYSGIHDRNFLLFLLTNRLQYITVSKLTPRRIAERPRRGIVLWTGVANADGA